MRRKNKIKIAIYKQKYFITDSHVHVYESVKNFKFCSLHQGEGQKIDNFEMFYDAQKNMFLNLKNEYYDLSHQTNLDKFNIFRYSK